MAEPKHFRKAQLASGPFLVGTYTIVSATGFGYRGNRTPAYLLDILPYGHIRLVTNLLMFIHMLISYSITSTVFCRSMHMRISPSTVNGRGASTMAWYKCFHVAIFALKDIKLLDTTVYALL